MKILGVLLALFCFVMPAWAADVKVSELPAATAVTSDDLLLIVDAPAGAIASKQISVSNFFCAGTAIEQGDVFYYNGTNIKCLPHGTAGQPLISGGNAANPSWLDTVLATGANTFSITKGTASLDVAAGAAVDINFGLTVNTAAVTLVGKSGGSSLTLPTAISFDGTMTNTYLCKYTTAGTILSCDVDPATYAAVGQQFYIGTTQVAINRATAALTLAGITLTTPVIGAATGTSLALTAGASTGGALTLKEGTNNGTDSSIITGAADAGTYPSFTFSGSQGGEDLTLAVTAANTWTVSSSTGVTDINFYGATTADPINLATTGTIRGAVKVIDMGNTAASYAILAPDAYGSMFLQTHGDAATDVTLPDYQAAADVDHAKIGATICILTLTAFATTIHPSGDDKIRTSNGTLNAAGAGVTGPATVGSFSCYMLTDVATDVGHWTQLGMNGAWPVH